MLAQPLHLHVEYSLAKCCVAVSSVCCVTEIMTTSSIPSPHTLNCHWPHVIVSALLCARLWTLGFSCRCFTLRSHGRCRCHSTALLPFVLQEPRPHPPSRLHPTSPPGSRLPFRLHPTPPPGPSPRGAELGRGHWTTGWPLFLPSSPDASDKRPLGQWVRQLCCCVTKPW